MAMAALFGPSTERNFDGLRCVPRTVNLNSRPEFSPAGLAVDAPSLRDSVAPRRSGLMKMGAMQYFPDFATFTRLAPDVDLVPVYRQLVSDTLTPVSAYCKLQAMPHPFLFESVVGG